MVFDSSISTSRGGGLALGSVATALSCPSDQSGGGVVAAAGASSRAAVHAASTTVTTENSGGVGRGDISSSGGFAGGAENSLSQGVSSAEAVMQWRRIQQEHMTPPKCRGHGETCKVRKVKEGPNLGRVFFCCPRPAGKMSDGGDCGFFQWAYGRSKKK